MAPQTQSPEIAPEPIEISNDDDTDDGSFKLKDREVQGVLDKQRKKADCQGGDAFAGVGSIQKYDHLSRVSVTDNQMARQLEKQRMKSEGKVFDAFADEVRGQKRDDLTHVPVAHEVAQKLAMRHSRSSNSCGFDAFQTEYCISLKKRSGTTLGLDVKAVSGGATLRVDGIEANCLVDEWNRMNTSAQVRLGDCIVECNGVTGAGHLLRELQDTEELSMNMSRRYVDENLSRFDVNDLEVKKKLARQRHKVDGIPEGCRDINGSYTDSWNKLVIVTQTGVDLVVNYGGEVKSGNVEGRPDGPCAVNVNGFFTSGLVDELGNVKFTDGGIWRKQVDCPGRTCHDMNGMYIDNWRSAVHVSQTGCDLVVKYRGKIKAGVVTGTKECCTGVVRVTSFAADGIIATSGDVHFSDGGYWKKQEPSWKPSPEMMKQLEKTDGCVSM